MSESKSAEKPEITIKGFVKVLGYLYLSDAKALKEVDALKEQEIATIINCSSEEIDTDELKEQFNIIELDLDDDHLSDLTQVIESTYDVLAAAKESGKCVLITCVTGKSVGPAIAIAYMLNSSKVSFFGCSADSIYVTETRKAPSSQESTRFRGVKACRSST